jgi:PilZ domain
VSRENRRFARVRPSGLVPRAGKIILDAKSPALDCNVVDLSMGGACLEVTNSAALPKRFVLLHGKTKKNCLVVWKAGRRIGVQF